MVKVMGHDIHVSFSQEELFLLLSAVNNYADILQDKYRRSEYFYRAYSDEYRKNSSEKNMLYILVRMRHLDELKALLLSHMPVDLTLDY